MFSFLLLSITSACNLSTFSACFKESKDSVKCIKSSNCIDHELEVKLEQSLVHIKGFSVSSFFKSQVSDLISCNLDKYEDCFSFQSSETVSCLVLTDCLDFTEISELQQENYGFYNTYTYNNQFFNFYNPPLQEGNVELAMTSISPNENSNNIYKYNQQPHVLTEVFSQNLYKDEVGLFNQRPADNEGTDQYESLSLSQVAEKISEVHDFWEVAQMATAEEKEKYRDYFDKDWNLIDIDVKLEELYKVYRKKIHEMMEKQNLAQNRVKTSGMFNDVNQEIPENQPDKRKMKENTINDSIFEELLENEESFSLTQTKPKVETVPPVHSVPVKTSHPSDPTSKESKFSSDLSSETKDFEKLWNPAKTENPTKDPEINDLQVSSSTFEPSVLFSSSFTPDNPEKADDSEFEPIFRDIDSSKTLSDSSNTETIPDSEGIEKSEQVTKKANFLQENRSCEEDCEKSCKSSEFQDSCISDCIYNTCSSSPASTSDYMTVLVTGLVLFLIAFIIYAFMKNRSSSRIHDNYIKGHSS